MFYCKLNGGRTRKVCVGCQFRDKRLYDGDRYHKDSTVFQCQVQDLLVSQISQVRPDRYGHKPVGCVTKDASGLTVERVLGCRWYRQEEDSKIEQTCILDKERSVAVVKTVSCIYRFRVRPFLGEEIPGLRHDPALPEHLHHLERPGHPRRHWPCVQDNE